MLSPIVVVKVGGAAVTDKASAEPRLDGDGFADAIKALCAAHTTTSLVVVVGAGSFGHGMAKAVGFSSGASVPSSQSKLLAAVGVRQQVMALAGMVAAALAERGVPAFHFTPLSLDGAKEPLLALLQARAVPLLHGDMIVDGSGGLRVLSGDVVAARLAEQLEAARLVFVSRHALHTRDPALHGEDAQLVREIRRSAGEYNVAAVGCENNDVSGAMRGKLQQVLAVRGVHVVIAPVARVLEAIAGPLPVAHCTTVWKV